MVLRAMLAAIEAEVTIVGNGQEALDALAAGSFDIVLMDINMPVMDGVTAITTIRRREAETRASRTPVLALTANAMDHQIAAYRDAGMDGFVEKPIDMASLFSAIEQALATPETGASSALTAA